MKDGKKSAVESFESECSVDSRRVMYPTTQRSSRSLYLHTYMCVNVHVQYVNEALPLHNSSALSLSMYHSFSSQQPLYILRFSRLIKPTSVARDHITGKFTESRDISNIWSHGGCYSRSRKWNVCLISNAPMYSPHSRLPVYSILPTFCNTHFTDVYPLFFSAHLFSLLIFLVKRTFVKIDGRVYWYLLINLIM